MTNEEAIKRIKLLQQDECDCIECEKNKEALMVVLNLIEKQDKRIRELETALIDEQLKHSEEIEKKDNDIQRMQSLLDLSDANNVEKDKIISKMAKFIDNNLKNCLLEVLNVNDVCERKELCKDCIIEYFEKEEG